VPDRATRCRDGSNSSPHPENAATAASCAFSNSSAVPSALFRSSADGHRQNCRLWNMRTASGLAALKPEVFPGEYLDGSFCRQSRVSVGYQKPVHETPARKTASPWGPQDRCGPAERAKSSAGLGTPPSRAVTRSPHLLKARDPIRLDQQSERAPSSPTTCAKSSSGFDCWKSSVACKNGAGISSESIARRAVRSRSRHPLPICLSSPQPKRSRRRPWKELFQPAFRGGVRFDFQARSANSA